MVTLFSKVKSASNIEDRLICRHDEQQGVAAHCVQNKHRLFIIIFYKQIKIVTKLIPH